ncbi:MAG: DMT family transporter [Acetobacteraceae bacterium]
MTEPFKPAPPAWLRGAPFVFLLLWSSGFVVLKVGLRYAEPLTFLSLRYLIVIALLVPAALVLRPPRPRGMAWVHLMVVGLLIQGGYFGLDYLAIELGAPAGTVALISALQPILIGLLAPWLAQETVTRRQWAGLILGLAGSCLVILSRSGVDAASPLSLLCAVGALLGMTFGTLYERRFGGRQHLVTANLVQCGTALVLLLPLAAWFETMRVQVTPGFVVSLGYLVVANSLVSISLLLAMLRAGSAAKVSAWFFLIPPVAAVVAWLVVGEVMPPVGWLGMAIAAAGVALVTR